MSLRMKLFGPRWGLTFQHDRDQRYELYGDSVIRIVGTVMTFYKNGGKPLEPWRLWLYCYKRKSGFMLETNHFTSDGQNITSDLIASINNLDPGFRVQGDPVFEDLKTKKHYPIYGKSTLDILAGNGDIFDLTAREETAYDIISKIFGR
jgi:hypothetical protein